MTTRRDHYVALICAATALALVAATAAAQGPETTSAPLAAGTTPAGPAAPATPSQEPLESPGASVDLPEVSTDVPAGPAGPQEAPSASQDVPRSDLTPGEVRSTSLLDVCPTGTQALRHTSTAAKRRIAARYGLRSRAGYTMDHLVPLGVGGADTEANIWPETHAGALLKDRCEDRARRLACRGDLPLAAAQRGFATDFVAFCASIGTPVR